MRVGIGVDQLGVDADAVARPSDAALEDIAHAELTAGLLRVNRLALVSKSGAASDHEAAGYSREIGRQIVGDAIREVFLVWIVAEIGKGQHNDREVRRPHTDLGNRCRTQTRIRPAPTHLRNKTVTAPGDSLNAAGTRSPMIENTAERRDLDAQVIILHYSVRPDGSYDFVLRDEIAPGRDQYTKQVERARADRYRDKHPLLIPPKQTSPLKAESFEQRNFAVGKRLHARSPKGERSRG